MSYIKTQWKTGDTITADKLNNIEQGIASSSSGGGMLLTISESGDDTVLDKNYTEIKTAVESGTLPFALRDDAESGLTNIRIVSFYGFEEGKYGVMLFSLGLREVMTFLSDTEDGVLTLDNSK